METISESIGDNATIWVVDDAPDLLHAVGALLVDAGYVYRGFADPREALAASEEDTPDLFIVDLNMPHMTGTELIKALRSRPETARTPILVLTAMTSEGALLNAFKVGADDVVRKPFSLSEMLVRIGWQLARSRQLSDLRRENQDLMLVTQLAKVMSQDESLQSLLLTLVQGVSHALPTAHASVYLVDPESGDLHRALPVHLDDGKVSPANTLDLREFPELSKALAAREPAFLGPDATARLVQSMGSESDDALTWASAAAFPMQLKSVLLGVLVMTSSTPRIGKSARESAIASIIADFAAVAVHRAGLFVSIREEHARMDKVSRDLARARDFLRGVIEASPDAVVVSDKDGEILLFNDAAERVLGWAKRDIIGRDVRDLYSDGGAERVMHLLRSERFGGRGRLAPKREILRDRDGVEIPVEISAAVIVDEAGEEVATVGVFSDVRSRIQMEEQLQEATESLERTRRQVIAAELAGAAAHELNQPLTSLLGYAELLRRRLEDDDENRRPVDKIYAEAKRIADVVRKIGRITEYKTKEYVGGTRIVDLDQSSGVEDEVTETFDEQRLSRRPTTTTAEYFRAESGFDDDSTH